MNLRVDAGQIVSILGPNGSGKTTLFRLLCTLMPLQAGEIQIGGFDCKTQPIAVRNQIGIVFQSPSLDQKLTVDENIACQGALYGIKGADLVQRRNELFAQLQLTERRGDFCETLSGGLKRRVELAKGMLHRPRLLLLDEPSTGLDPAARLSFWDAIQSMADEGMAVLMTTHLLEEADKADRVSDHERGKGDRRRGAGINCGRKWERASSRSSPMMWKSVERLLVERARSFAPTDASSIAAANGITSLLGA